MCYQPLQEVDKQLSNIPVKCSWDCNKEIKYITKISVN